MYASVTTETKRTNSKQNGKSAVLPSRTPPHPVMLTLAQHVTYTELSARTMGVDSREAPGDPVPNN